MNINFENKKKLQQAYNTFIKLANLHYTQSGLKEYIGLQNIVYAKSEAWEDAANYLWQKFPDEIIPTTTLRFKEIRRDNLEAFELDVECKNIED